MGVEASGSAARQLSAEALPVLLSLEVTTLRGRGCDGCLVAGFGSGVSPLCRGEAGVGR